MTFDLKLEIRKIKNDCNCAGCFEHACHDFKQRTENQYSLFMEAMLSDEVLYLSDNPNSFLFSVVLNAVKTVSDRFDVLVHILKLEKFNLRALSILNLHNYKNEFIYYLIENKYIYRVFPDFIEKNFTALDDAEIDKAIERITKLDNQTEILNYFACFDVNAFHSVFIKIIDYYLKYNELKLEPIIIHMHEIAQSKEYPFLKDTTNYILKNINHTRLPFKGSNYKAKSIEEYNVIKNKIDWVTKKLQEEQSPLYNKILNAKKELADINEELEKLLVLKNEAEKFLEKLTRNESRMRELEIIASHSPLERIKAMITSDKSILYFPEYFLMDAPDYFPLLTEQEATMLAEKMKPANTSIYKTIKKTLKEYINNKS